MTTTPTVFGYYGSKARLAHRIVDTFPPHRGYVEPFAGSLAVLLARSPRPGAIEVANDLDGDLVTFWRVLRDQVEDLERVCSMTPHSREEIAAADLDADVDDLERARRVWVRLSQGRGGVLGSTGWRYHETTSRGGMMPGTLAGYVGRFALVADRLRSVTLESRPAVDVIEAYGREASTLLYVDPPYVRSTRSSGGGKYRHEMTEDDHRELAAALHAAAGPVVVSGYDSDLYADLFGDWHRLEIPAWTGQGNGRRPGHRTEVLWSSRPLVTGLW